MDAAERGFDCKLKYSVSVALLQLLLRGVQPDVDKLSSRALAGFWFLSNVKLKN
jgi:hypothetical protein